MRATTAREIYSPREIARASGVPDAQILRALGVTANTGVFLCRADAVRLGRAAVKAAKADRTPLSHRLHESRRPLVPFAVSSTLHAGVVAAVVFITSFGLTPTAATRADDERPREHMHLVFLATPGPGGGGGGGGVLRKTSPPKALRKGVNAISSPVPPRKPPSSIEPAAAPPEPKPAPLAAEPLPVLAAPIISAPADRDDRVGLLEEARDGMNSRGSGTGGGVGSGTGTGVGEGAGAGIGAGSGGGTGGGPYRPGSGIEPPRIVREVKAGYTEDARRRSVEGTVVLEIVVKRDGSVASVRILDGLDPGLNDRAVAAVRQWRFEPARRLGTPVDVVVEVAVEFTLR